MHACIYIRIMIIISIMKTSILKINIENLFLVITELSVLTNKIPCPTTQIITVFYFFASISTVEYLSMEPWYHCWYHVVLRGTKWYQVVPRGTT